MPRKPNAPEALEQLLQQREEILARRDTPDLIQASSDIATVLPLIEQSGLNSISELYTPSVRFSRIRAEFMRLFEEATLKHAQILFTESLAYLDNLEQLATAPNVEGAREQIQNLLYQAYDELGLQGAEYIRVRSIYEAEKIRPQFLAIIAARRRQLTALFEAIQTR